MLCLKESSCLVRLTAFGDKHPLTVSNPEPAEWTPPVANGKRNKARNAKKKPA
jgi:hypothetical protein